MITCYRCSRVIESEVKSTPMLTDTTKMLHIGCTSREYPGMRKRFDRAAWNAAARRGACLAALVELLELTGHRVELTVVDVNADCDRTGMQHETRVVVKPYDQPIDLPVLSYALAHPSMHRIAGFSIMEQQTAPVREALGAYVGSFYGMPADAVDNLGDLYIGRTYYGEVQWTDPRSAERWIRERLAALGVVLKESHAA